MRLLHYSIRVTGANVEAAATASVNTVSLSEKLPDDSYVRLSGSFDTVNVMAQSIVVEIPEGSIDSLNVSDGATSSSIKMDKEAAVLKMVLNAAVEILGEGTVKNAVVNAEGIKMDKAPENVTVGEDVKDDVKVEIGGEAKPAVPPSTQPVVTGPSTPSDSTAHPSKLRKAKPRSPSPMFRSIRYRECSISPAPSLVKARACRSD